jgi:hypothetical protein
MEKFQAEIEGFDLASPIPDSATFRAPQADPIEDASHMVCSIIAESSVQNSTHHCLHFRFLLLMHQSDRRLVIEK